MTFSAASVSELTKRVGIWEARQFRHDGSPPSLAVDVLIIVEELGELTRCINKRDAGIRGDSDHWGRELRKELGDVVIALLGLSANFSIEFTPDLRKEDLEPSDLALVLSAYVGSMSEATLRSDRAALAEAAQGAFSACELLARAEELDLECVVRERWETVEARVFHVSSGDD